MVDWVAVSVRSLALVGCAGFVLALAGTAVIHNECVKSTTGSGFIPTNSTGNQTTPAAQLFKLLETIANQSIEASASASTAVTAGGGNSTRAGSNTGNSTSNTGNSTSASFNSASGGGDEEYAELTTKCATELQLQYFTIFYDFALFLPLLIVVSARTAPWAPCRRCCRAFNRMRVAELRPAPQHHASQPCHASAPAPQGSGAPPLMRKTWPHFIAACLVLTFICATDFWVPRVLVLYSFTHRAYFALAMAGHVVMAFANSGMLLAFGTLEADREASREAASKDKKKGRPREQDAAGSSGRHPGDGSSAPLMPGAHHKGGGPTTVVVINRGPNGAAGAGGDEVIEFGRGY